MVTLLVLVLTLLANFRSCFQSSIPPLKANRLLLAQGEFLQQAAHQPVDWRPLGSESLAEARRLAKPILLVIGTPWSEAARTIDSGIFSNRSVAAQINENFVPIRIDAVQQPRWYSAFLPTTRLALPYSQLRMVFTGGFQAYVLDTRGRLLSYIPPIREGQYLDLNSFTDALVAAKDLFSRSELTDQPILFNQFQVYDLDQLEGAAPGMLPDFDTYANALGRQLDRTNGGFSEAGIPRALPMAFLYEWRSGRRGDVAATLDPLLLSPLVDVVRGGIFSLRYTGGRTLVDFDQVTTRNAEFAALLAEASSETHDPLYDRVAHDIFDMLVRDLREQRLFVACRQSDQGPRSRSASASFPDKRSNEVLTDEEHAWVRSNLGLDAFSNRQMIPFFRNRRVLDDPMLPEVLAKMRSAPGLNTITAGAGCLDINGHTAACLLKCVRLWGDGGRLNELLDTVEVLEPFRRNADVVHLRDSDQPGAYLGDYLAYSDTALQDYLNTGRVVSFVNGLAVLEQAMNRFKGEEPGLYLLVPPANDPLLPKNIDVPELEDDARESCTAQMIRLLMDYGRMLGPSPEGRQLLAAASDTASRFSHLEDSASPTHLQTPPSAKLAGYYVAAAGSEDRQCAFAIGAHAQELADQLYRLRPGRLVAAAFGPVRPDLRSRKPGIYVANGQVVAGPYTVQ